MSTIEELRQRKERLELEAEITKLQKQKDRREAVDRTLSAQSRDQRVGVGIAACCFAVGAGIWLLLALFK